MGMKLRERATGQLWTIMGDTEGHSMLEQGEAPRDRPKTYRIKSESSGEERLIASDLQARYEILS
jgi:hypothetical protein